MLDFHTHILPGIDDGSRDKEESIEIIEQQMKEKVELVVASPHFYPDKDIEVFIEERQAALVQLGEVEYAIYLGAEVLLSIDTPKLSNLRELAIEGTEYLLIEMPFSHWSEWVYTALQEIIDNHNLIPIIAHIERYDAAVGNLSHINRLIEMGCLIQVNTISLRPTSSRKKFIKKLMKKRLIHVLGSDVHRKNGLISIAQGYGWIEKQYGKEVVEWIQGIGEQVIGGERVTPIMDKPFKKFLGVWWI